jgi:hypothetical protein
VFLIGCQPTASEPSPTIAPPSASPLGGVGLPSDCQPIDLRDPSGARVDLSGEWESLSELVAPNERVWLQQIGDCLYGSVSGVDSPESDASETYVVDLGGRVSTGFTANLDVVFVYQDAVIPYVTYSTMEMIIDWDTDGRIHLREDRDVTERPARCAITGVQCSPPVIWYRSGEAPTS